jgi:glycosyltransferase involved in cell wall biosynthesis
VLTMVNPSEVKERMQIAFVSSCLPRKCGIATFSANLSHALENNVGLDAVSFIALNNNGSYDYTHNVIIEIEQDKLDDYCQAASLINSSEVDVVSLQHEFGLFGGPDGIYLQVFLKHLEKPVVTTFHTVLQSPSPGQKKAFMETAASSRALVVMNSLAIDFMTDIYDIPRSKIHLIPHGVSETEYKEPSYYKQQLQLQDHFLILTFGFLSPNKGIEIMLEALPAVVEKHSHVLYMILGITHPVEKKQNGEAYRESLETMVKKLGLAQNVIFIDAFVDDEAMDRYVGAADLVVCPYHSGDQITSGVLSAALSKGKAIISTPYLHAQEALSEGRGRLVNANDPAAMSAETMHLLENPREREALAQKAYALGRQMGWSSVSRQYLETFEGVIEPAVKVRTLQQDRLHKPAGLRINKTIKEGMHLSQDLIS